MIKRFELYFVPFLCALCCCGVSNAGGGPENLVIVVNANSQSSKLIANHYIQLRNIPPRNVIYLKSVPNKQKIGITHFMVHILRPIQKQIQKRNLAGQIDYVVYSADFPTVFSFVEDPSKSRMFRPIVSINSLTYFKMRAKAGQRSFFSLDANSYMRTRNLQLLSRPFVGKPQEQFEDALRLSRKKEYDGAIKILEPLARQHPNQVAVSYWLARIYARKQDVEASLRWLNRAVVSGWSFRNFTKSDLAFEQIANNPAFQRLVATIPDNSYRFMPSKGFRSRYRWGPNGMVNNTADQGESYVLSTVLAATRLRGTSEREALDQITRSVKSDGSHPKGTFYFTKTGDIRTKCRMTGIDRAVEELKELGHEAEIVRARLPKEKRDIVGLSIGTPSFDFVASKNQIVPGAICENLTSAGGVLFARHAQTPLSEFIAAGAAGSSGTVVEPYAIPKKFPDPRIHVHYVNGCSLAEAFYQSVHGPFQLLIIGDPLCQPWATFPMFDVDGIEPGETVSGIKKLSFDFSASPVSVRGVEFYMDGKLISRLPNSRGFSINTADIADGFHELRIVAVAENAVETQGRVIVPFFVSNQNQRVMLERDNVPVGLEDVLKFRVAANCGNKLELLHNGRVIASADRKKATFKVPARELGRGSVQLIARAKKAKLDVYSNPITFKVIGKINTVRVTNVAKKKTQKSAPKKPAKSK